MTETRINDRNSAGQSTTIAPTDGTTERVPWYDYSRGGWLDPLAVRPGKQKESMTRACGFKHIADQRMVLGPEENLGLDPNRSIESPLPALTHVLCILNPFAGQGRAKRTIWPLLKEALTKDKTDTPISYELFESQYAGHIEESLIDKDLGKVNAILVMGGDGTVNEVINGLMSRSKSAQQSLPPLGLLPGGTGNSTVAALGMMDAELAIETILKGRRWILSDLCKCSYQSTSLQEQTPDSINSSPETKKTTSRYMLQLVAWGLGVEANIAAEGMRWLGNARYDVAALINIMSGKSRSMHIQGTCEDKHTGKSFELKGDYALAFAMNCSIGGTDLRLAPYAKINDGYLDLCVAEGRSRMGLLRLFDDLKRNGCHAYSKGVYQYRFKEILLDSPGTS